MFELHAFGITSLALQSLDLDILTCFLSKPGHTPKIIKIQMGPTSYIYLNFNTYFSCCKHLSKDSYKLF